MRIYLAARYSKWPIMLGKAADLKDRGHTVVARWITGFQEACEKTPALRAQYAQEDLDDIDCCDTLILFGEPEGTAVRGGGRFFEFGYAYGRCLQCILIGGREHVFCHLPAVKHYETWEEFLATLEAPGTPY